MQGLAFLNEAGTLNDKSEISKEEMGSGEL